MEICRPLPTSPSFLYRMDLTTGKLTSIDFASSFTAIAIAPVSPCLDIDSNGSADPLTDGLMLLRSMFGLPGASITSGALPAASPRNTTAAIMSHLNANCGTRLQ